ncbi:MAG: carboxypeptidase regulatory-like domain-containing protein [Isosphaeraceae bacterium]
MRIPRRWANLLLGVGCSSLVGCSQTGWMRSTDPSDIKTVASINGKPVATVTGEPGTGTARHEDNEDTAPRPATGSRISGRVVDEEGQPVANAMVRLGVGGSSGGRVNFATTDRSGAFTLHRLRPGINYTLIAESQGEDGMLSGRVQSRAPRTDAQITISARDRETEAEPRGKVLAAKMRSALFPDEETDGFPGTVHSRVAAAPEGRQESAPAAAESAKWTPRMPHLLAARSSAGSSADPGRGGANDPLRQASDRRRGAAAVDDGREGPPQPEPIAATGDDEGENPLPPAGESRAMLTSRGPNRVSRAHHEGPRPNSDAATESASDGVAPASYSRDGDEVDGERAVIRPRRAPALRPSDRAASSRSARPAEHRGSAEAADESVAPPGDEDAAPPVRRKKHKTTWRELAISPDDVPYDEALRRSSMDEDDIAEDQGVVRAVLPQEGEHAPERKRQPEPQVEPGAEHQPQLGPLEKGRRTPPARPARQGEPSGAASRGSVQRAHAASRGSVQRTPSRSSVPDEGICRLDAGGRRIVDLQLPGLDGRMMSIKDFDADVIILDFWGSWCRQCEKSIEYHRRLQEELGRKVQVIGIACEKSDDPEARRKLAAAATRRLGINYPVMVTGMQGSCPVQRALRVQFYPTIVVLDRQGNILQFEQGATDATLSRIDRAVSARVERP